MSLSASQPATPPLRKHRRILFRLLAVLLGASAGLVLVEISLRCLPNVQLRIRGGRIALPVNQRTVFENAKISRVDREIVQTRNSLGFRGADPPAKFSEMLSIVVVGGSTTECYYLSDDKTWPERLKRQLDGHFGNLWLNNAGLDGHSTFGHLRLFDQYLATLHPRCIVFLIGANDVGLEQSNEVDERLQRGRGDSGVIQIAYFWLVEHSATAALFDNLRRTLRARAAGVVHQDVNHTQLKADEARSAEIAPEAVAELLERHRTRYLPQYRRRVELLVERCRLAGILPVLVTQPALFGPAIDPETGVDLGRVAIGEFDGETKWLTLELYNSVTRDVARDRDVPLIDLARLMPKDSQYFYDYYHFTNDGADEVAQLIEPELRRILAAAFPAHCNTSGAE